MMMHDYVDTLPWYRLPWYRLPWYRLPWVWVASARRAALVHLALGLAACSGEAPAPDCEPVHRDVTCTVYEVPGTSEVQAQASEHPETTVLCHEGQPCELRGIIIGDETSECPYTLVMHCEVTQ